MNCSKFIELHMIKEYQPTTNRYFVRIKLNYKLCLYYLDMLCICVAGLKLFYSSGIFTIKFQFKIKM